MIGGPANLFREYWMIYRWPAFSRSCDLAPRPPPPPSLPSVKFDWRQTGRLRKRDNMLTENGWGGGGARTKLNFRQKARSSINHSILAGTCVHCTVYFYSNYKSKIDPFESHILKRWTSYSMVALITKKYKYTNKLFHVKYQESYYFLIGVWHLLHITRSW